MVVKTLAPGDPCPGCGGDMKPARVPTDAEFAKAFDKENPVALAPGTDTAAPDVRAELGALYRCVTCRYQARFKGDEPEPVDNGRKARK